MDVQAYLRRIHYEGDPKVDLQTLRKLQYQHLLHIPFENLSIHYGEKIKLDLDWLFDKVIRRGRGGFCFELNALFCALLQEIGFRARLVSARVSDGKGGFGPEFDHMAIIVDLPGAGTYLVDVGFGRFASHPLQITLDRDQREGRYIYRITRYDPRYFLVKHSARNMPFDDDYLFSLLSQDLEDFEERCRHHQTSPDSHFTQKKVCSKLTREGRISLSNDKLTITRKGQREEIPVSGEADFLKKLEAYFQIDLKSHSR
jgi:N-hydroxyarylamine O-acetyltransferase